MYRNLNDIADIVDVFLRHLGDGHVPSLKDFLCVAARPARRNQ